MEEEEIRIYYRDGVLFNESTNIDYFDGISRITYPGEE
jgi:hypothetical protein